MNVILTLVHIFGLVTMGFSGLMTTCLITSKIADDGATAAFFTAAPSGAKLPKSITKPPVAE